MRKFLATILVLALALTSIYAESNTKTRSFKYDDITSIIAGSIYQINVTKGSSNMVEVIYPKELEGKLNISSYTPGELVFGLDNSDNKNSRYKKHETDYKIIVNMSMQTIRKIKLSGVSSFRSNDSFKTDDLDIIISGVSLLKDLNISGKNINLKISGVSNASIKGNFNNLNVIESGVSQFSFDGNVKEQTYIKLSGSSSAFLKGTGTDIYSSCSGTSKIDAKNFIAKNGEAYASGVSNIDIYSSANLKLKASSPCKITYYGSPSIINLSPKRSLIKGED